MGEAAKAENLALPSIKHANHQRRLNQNRASKPIRVHSHLHNNQNHAMQYRHQHKIRRTKRNNSRSRSYLRESGSGSKRSSQSPAIRNNLIKKQPVSARNQLHSINSIIHSSKSHMKPYGSAPSSEQQKKIGNNKFMDHDLLTDE